MAAQVEWSAHPTLAALLANRREGGAALVAPASREVTLAIPGPVFSSVGAATAFVPFPVNRADVPTRGLLPSPFVEELATPPEPPATESSLVPFCPPNGPMGWSSRDDAGET